MTLQMQTTKTGILFVAMAALMVAGLSGGVAALHHRRVRMAAEDGLRQEIQANDAGIQEMRAAIPKEMANISSAAALLKDRSASHVVDGPPVRIGLAVMSLTNANWQTATATGAVRTMDYNAVQRFAGAYFEQARLAQLQTSTLESMMSLSAYVGNGEKLETISPEDARAAEIEARSLIAHLGMMLRMTDGVLEAYKTALAKQPSI
jgi:hypothetical protein